MGAHCAYECDLYYRPERYLWHLNGGLAVSGRAHAMPSLSLEADAQSVTADTLYVTQVNQSVHSASFLPQAQDAMLACF